MKFFNIKTTHVIMAVSTLFTTGANASAVQCFKALNPEAIQIRGVDIKKASLRLIPESKTADGYKMYPQAEFTVQAEGGNVVTATPFLFGTDNKTYSVECDGGNVRITRSGSVVVANSQYLRIDGSEDALREGCGSVESISMEDALFVKVACKK